MRDGHPIFLEDHLAGLKRQCQELRLQMPDISVELIHQLIEENQIDGVARMRIIITGGTDPSRGLPWRKGSLAITLEPFPIPPQKPLRLARFSTPLSLVHAHLKTLANFNRYFIMQEAQERGFHDGISISSEGYILEASFGNLFWIKGETLYTPARSLPLYFGVTLQNVIKQWKGEVKEVKAKQIDPDAIVFRSSSMLGVVPVEVLEDQEFEVQAHLYAS